MSTYILVNSANTIVNVIEWDGSSPYTPPNGVALIQYAGPAGVGWSWNGTAATDPTPPPTPPVRTPTVSATQARLALLQTPNPNAVANGTGATGPTLLDVVNAAIAADTTGVLPIWWEYSVMITQSDPHVQTVATTIGLTSAQVSSLFALAVTL